MPKNNCRKVLTDTADSDGIAIMSKASDQAARMIEAASTWRNERKIDSFELGAAMRDYRIDCGASLRKIALAVGVSAPFLSDCERGFRKLSEEDLTKYVAACDAAEKALMG